MRFSLFIELSLTSLVVSVISLPAQNEIDVRRNIEVMGGTKPIPVSGSRVTGEIDRALQFDLYVQGFSFTSPETAQYQITGSNNGHVQGRLFDTQSKSAKFSKSYSGASLRRQIHALSDDIVEAVTGKKGIAQTRISFK